MECNSKWNVIQKGMSLKMKCHSRNRMPLKAECHLKWNDIKNGMSLKMQCHSKLNFNQSKMSLKKMSFKWNVTQNRMELKMECH